MSVEEGEGDASRGIARVTVRGAEGEEIDVCARAWAACSTVQASMSIAGVDSTPLWKEERMAMIAIEQRLLNRKDGERGTE